MKFKVAIPARYASQRLPGKPLVMLKGKPMIQHVYEHAVASGAEQVVIATDDERVQTAAEGFGAEVCMTSANHTSGTDRLAETATKLGWADNDIVVNLQGDEPLMPAANIRQAAENLSQYSEAKIATLCVPITSWEEFNNPNVVKVVRDKQGYALYFSRAPIPWDRDREPGHDDVNAPMACRHIGLYAYRVSYLHIFSNQLPCELEQLERLEQLRALWQGEKIHVAECAEPPGMGIDTPEDVVAIEILL